MRPVTPSASPRVKSHLRIWITADGGRIDFLEHSLFTVWDITGLMPGVRETSCQQADSWSCTIKLLTGISTLKVVFHEVSEHREGFAVGIRDNPCDNPLRPFYAIER
jgi:hypothetical protein